MFRSMMRAKAHGATVTEVNLHYEGSLTLDLHIMEKLDILPNEQVQVVNVNNGARLETYIIPGLRDSGTVALNGAAARLAQTGDTILLIFYATVTEEEARRHKPIVAILGKRNRIVEIRGEEKSPISPGKGTQKRRNI